MLWWLLFSCSVMSNSCNPMDYISTARLLSSWEFPGKNTAVGSCFLLQGILPFQESNSSFLHWQADSTSELPGKLYYGKKVH